MDVSFKIILSEIIYIKMQLAITDNTLTLNLNAAKYIELPFTKNTCWKNDIEPIANNIISPFLEKVILDGIITSLKLYPKKK